MQFCFFGTDEFSVTILEELKKTGLLPALIITAPDRPKGRGLKYSPPPVKEWARANNVPILQPEHLDSALNLQLKTYNLQLIAVASYGRIIPKETLDIPVHGALNLHPSLLPKYRGPTPIESQILADEKDIGVTIMLMDEKMDHGPIVAKQQLDTFDFSPLTFNRKTKDIPKASELEKELAHVGGKLFAEVMPKWMAGELKAVPQDESKATYTRKFTKADGEINLSDDPYKNFLKILAFADTIGTYFFASLNSPFPKGSGASASRGISKSSVPNFSEKVGDTSFMKGGMGNRQIRVIIKDAEFRDGKLFITRVIPEGKKEMSYNEFLRGIKKHY